MNTSPVNHRAKPNSRCTRPAPAIHVAVLQGHGSGAGG